MMVKFLKKHKLLIAIILIASFLRLYRLPENLVFHGETGFDYLQIVSHLEDKTIPLKGPPTSHPWFSIAPLFYWLFMLILPLGNYEPLFASYFMALVGISAVPVCYLVVKRIFDENKALLASFLLGISPAWILLTRHSRFNSFTALLFFPFIYFLYLSLKKDINKLFWVGVILGLMLSFFPSPFVLLPAAAALLFIYRKKVTKKSLWLGILGFSLPNVPYIIFHIKDGFNMFIKIVAWIPYRVLGFFGIIPKNQANPFVLKENLTSLYTFFQESYFVDTNLLFLFFFVFLSTYLLFRFYTSFKKKSVLWMSFFVIFLVSYMGLFLHGDPPQHYYLVIFPLPIIFGAVFMDKLSQKFKWGATLIFFFLCFLAIYNFKYYFSQSWFYKSENKVTVGELPVPYDLQKKVVRFILKDSEGKEFSLKRVGPNDHFDKDFAQNYIYLFWKNGKKPAEDALLTYTIYEEADRLPKEKVGQVFWVSNIAILKEEK